MGSSPVEVGIVKIIYFFNFFNVQFEFSWKEYKT